MKKLIAILLLTMSVFLVSGQATYSDSREDFLSAIKQNKKFRARMAAGNILSIQEFSYRQNNQVGVLVYEGRYDKRGNDTDWVSYKNGKVKVHSSVSYDDSNRMTVYAVYQGAQKLKWIYTTTYDKSGNPIEEDFYKKNPQVISSKTIKTYDTQNNIIESKVFDKKSNLKSQIKYTYYNDGSKKQTIEYSGSGKVKRIWNFDCNPVGELEAKKFKDTSKICVHYETDKDGNPIKVKEQYTGAGFLGSTIRNITKYDKDNNVIDNVYYKLNGKQIGRWSASYNTSGRITEQIYYDGGTNKTRLRYTYKYGNDGNVTEAVIYKKEKPLPFTTMKYVYTSSLSSPAK